MLREGGKLKRWTKGILFCIIGQNKNRQGEAMGDDSNSGSHRNGEAGAHGMAFSATLSL